MIDLNLLLFGGNGSGSGGGKGGSGGGKGGTGSTSSNSPGHHGSAGGTNMSSGGNKSNDRKESSDSKEKTKGKSTAVSDPVSRITDPNATYVLYNSRGKELREVSGKALLQNIKEERLTYKPWIDKWENSKGLKIIIRRRK